MACYYKKFAVEFSCGVLHISLTYVYYMYVLYVPYVRICTITSMQSCLYNAKKKRKQRPIFKVNCRKSKVCVQQATETAAITLNPNLEVWT